eukprot:scaffold58395_cov40-Prasinocladus_malaysianus.AAC.1
MPLVDGGDMRTAVNERGSLSEGDAKDVMHQVFSTCAELHRRGIIHRDIKLDNIVLSHSSCFDKDVTLLDMGLAVSIRGHRASQELTRCGTPAYCAPDVLSGEGYGFKVDVWSCGVTLFQLLSGYLPFRYSQLVDMATKNHKTSDRFKAAFEDPVWELISDEARSLVCQCLEFDPKRRISAEQALLHPWFEST